MNCNLLLQLANFGLSISDVIPLKNVLEEILNVTIWVRNASRFKLFQCCFLTNSSVLQMFCVLSDGYAYYEEWQHLVQKSDQQVKQLLENFGSKCKDLGVCEIFLQVSSGIFT